MAIELQTPVMSKSISTPLVETRNNMMFAVGAERGKSFINPFADTQRITIPEHNGQPIGIEVVAGTRANVETLLDEVSGCCVYRWGMAAHPDVPKSELLKWVIGVASTGDFSPLRQLVGTFVILIDDRKNQRVRIISDVLGFRPWHVGVSNGRLVCGSEVWAIQRAGFDMGGVNYDAVATWFRFIFDCTEKGLFNNFPPMGYGVVGTWEHGQYSEAKYFQIKGGLAKPSMDEIIDGMHSRITRTFDALISGVERVSVPLSGGFDSRYSAALASRRKDLKVEALCICDREAEGIGASMVAKALGIPLQTIPTDGSTWNMYAEPYHFTPAGFPITKQCSYIVASQRPGVPTISGFFGDPMNRGSLDRIEGKTEAEHKEELPLVWHRNYISRHTLARFDLLDSAVVKRSDERAIAVLRKRFSQWMDSCHPMVGVSITSQQRHYMSNNIIEHLHVSEAVLPFYSWETLQFKFQNDPSCFSYDVYGKLLAKFFPEMAHIPHNDKMGSKNDLIVKPSRVTKKWAAAVLRGLSRSNSLSVLSRRKAIPRLIGAMMGRADVEVVARFLYRLFLLEDRLHRAGVAFDWNEI